MVLCSNASYNSKNCGRLMNVALKALNVYSQSWFEAAFQI